MLTTPTKRHYLNLLHHPYPPTPYHSPNHAKHLPILISPPKSAVLQPSESELIPRERKISVIREIELETKILRQVDSGVFFGDVDERVVLGKRVLSEEFLASLEVNNNNNSFGGTKKDDMEDVRVLSVNYVMDRIRGVYAILMRVFNMAVIEFNSCYSALRDGFCVESRMMTLLILFGLYSLHVIGTMVMMGYRFFEGERWGMNEVVERVSKLNVQFGSSSKIMQVHTEQELEEWWGMFTNTLRKCPSSIGKMELGRCLMVNWKSGDVLGSIGVSIMWILLWKGYAKEGRIGLNDLKEFQKRIKGWKGVCF